MSVLTDLIYGGSHAVAGLTEGAVNDAIAKYGADHPIAFPDTAYFFPTIYAATGVKVKTLGDLPACVGVLKSLITDQEDLGQALNAGLATAVGAEILEGLKFAEPKDAYEQATVPGIGFVPDPIIRSLGVPLVTGDIPGVAVVLGKADNGEDVAKVVKDYQSKGIMTFMVGDVIEQCADAGVKMGLELRVIPLGHDVTAVIHVVTVAIRAALIFGNVQPGDLAGLLKYTKERVPAFVNTFGAIDNVVVSAGAGAIALGFPVVVDIDLGENQVPGALESCTDHSRDRQEVSRAARHQDQVQGAADPRRVRGRIRGRDHPQGRHEGRVLVRQEHHLRARAHEEHGRGRGSQARHRRPGYRLRRSRVRACHLRLCRGQEDAGRLRVRHRA